ncbi:MAG: site-specific DNA-methyltransferase [Candidatus Thorarchaeota archaeon]
MSEWKNIIIHDDCLNPLEGQLKELQGQVRTIYIDPPFFSGTDYTLKSLHGGSGTAAPNLHEVETYSDKWKGGLDEYLEFLRVRIRLMRDLLSESGSLWLHLDTRTSHYAKVMMDKIFGQSNFVNEIIWRRTNSPKAQSTGFGTQHDVILLYAKDASKFKVKPIYRKHDEKSMKPYRYRDERGQFRLIEIEAHGIQRGAGRKQFEWRGRVAPYLYKKETLDKWWREGFIYTSKNGRYSKKQYLHDTKGVLVSDLWLDIPPLQGGSEEFTGFLTQKPLALLKRVIECSSEGGDLVADFFAGSGTTAVAAQRLNRRWIACDKSPVALNLLLKRLGLETDDLEKVGVKIIRKQVKRCES